MGSQGASDKLATCDISSITKSGEPCQYWTLAPVRCRKSPRPGSISHHAVSLHLPVGSITSPLRTTLSDPSSEAFLGTDQESVKQEISKLGSDGFVAALREKLIAKRLIVKGRSIVDEQGAMLLADEVDYDTTSAHDAANEVIQRWGVIL